MMHSSQQMAPDPEHVGLGNVAQVMEPTGRVLVFEMVMPETPEPVGGELLVSPVIR